MEKKNLWLVVIIVAILAVVAGYFYWSSWRADRAADEELIEEQEALQDLTGTLDEAAALPDVEAPSANPLDKLVPQKNPIEAANPFKGVYENPFE